MSDFNQLAKQYHQDLPGIVRATLLDFGVSNEVIDRFGLGWDGDATTVPIRTKSGRVGFLEAWNARSVGVPLDDRPAVELFGWQTLLCSPQTVVVAEGVHEALIFESHGLPAVAATGSGRFFKGREWASSFVDVRVLLAYNSGEHAERRKFLPSREQLREKARFAVPHAEVVLWPCDFKRDQGAFEFFVVRGSTREEFLALARQ